MLCVGKASVGTLPLIPLGTPSVGTTPEFATPSVGTTPLLVTLFVGTTPVVVTPVSVVTPGISELSRL